MSPDKNGKREYSRKGMINPQHARFFSKTRIQITCLSAIQHRRVLVARDAVV